MAQHNTRHCIQAGVKKYVACLASGKNIKHKVPKNESGKFITLTEPGQEIHFDFSGALHNEKQNKEDQLLVELERFSEWPTVKNANSPK